MIRFVTGSGSHFSRIVKPDVGLGLETVHKGKQLSDNAFRGFMRFVSALSRHTIYLIKEDDRFLFFPRRLKQLPDQLFALARTTC